MYLSVFPRDLPVQHLEGFHVSGITSQNLSLQRERLPHLLVHLLKVPARAFRREVVSMDDGANLPSFVVEAARR